MRKESTTAGRSETADTGQAEAVRHLAVEAKQAARALAGIPAARKDRLLQRIADLMTEREAELMDANGRDVQSAREGGCPTPLVDRLTLTPQRLSAMRDSLASVIGLPDPVGEMYEMRTRPNGLRIGKMRIPIGVVAVIYESRPNVTIDCAALCLKSGNAAILRGGREAAHSNRALAGVVNHALQEEGWPKAAVTLVPFTDRACIDVLVRLDGLVDLVIPRGGEALIRRVVEGATVPVIKHDKGVCHTFVDRTANLDQAEAIACNAKVQRPGTCNALETLLVHEAVADRFLPRMVERFRQAGVAVRGCPQTQRLVRDVEAASDEDWMTEYLDLIVSVRVVESFEQAIEHIGRYGSGHSDAIVTSDYGAAMAFLQRVDAAAVYVNASTRFTDGYEFGLGAEIGISTNRLHARGPMGLQELTTYKYIVFGDGQIRE